MSDVLNGVLPLVGVAVGAGLQLLLGRSLETSKQLKVARAQAYADFFKAVALLATKGHSVDALGLAADAKSRICIYGSPEVVKRLRAFEEQGPIIGSDQSKAIIAALLLEMRKDIDGTARNLNEQDIHLVVFGALRK
jgi:hypothetical protein